VLFFEHKKLYRSLKEITPDHCELVDLESARIVTEGADATIITFGMGVNWAIEAAEAQLDLGVHIEIIDLRSLAPIDWKTIETSIKKTNRVLLLEEASEVLGPMSEIAAGISEHFFQHLDAPVTRCSSIHTPIPFSKELEKGYMANFRLEEKLEILLSY
jgi:2-oxoisovalerate dehydrogenase E1 component